MPTRKLLKRLATMPVPALLATTLVAACTAPGDDVGAAKAFEVQELTLGAPSAGCWYTTSGESMPVMVVHHGSHDGNPPGWAGIRIDGMEHVLGKIGSASGEPFRYGNDSVLVEAFDFRNIGPDCSGECEGSFHEARLRIDYDGRSELPDVSVHCGA